MGQMFTGGASATLTQATGATPTLDLGVAAHLDSATFRRVRKVNAQVSGTFGGATVNFEGQLAGQPWVALTDGSGAALTLAAAGQLQLLTHEFGPWTNIRARVSGGDGTTALLVSIEFSTGF